MVTIDVQPKDYDGIIVYDERDTICLRKRICYAIPLFLESDSDIFIDNADKLDFYKIYKRDGGLRFYQRFHGCASRLDINTHDTSLLKTMCEALEGYEIAYNRIKEN